MTMQEKIARKLDKLQSAYDAIAAQCISLRDSGEVIPDSLQSECMDAYARLRNFADYWSLDYASAE